MGVGTPTNIIEAVARGVDFFDCVMPARNARHGRLYTWEGSINIKNEKYKLDDSPIRHLFAAGEMLAMRLAVLHNLYFYNMLMTRIRTSLDNCSFAEFRREYSEKLERKI